MNGPPRQLGLFDAHQGLDPKRAETARACMRATIEELRIATVAPWKDQIGVIMRDATFKRASLLVPSDEAEALWDEYNVEMERLYAIWALTQEQPEG